MFWHARRKPEPGRRPLDPPPPDITADRLAGLFPGADADAVARGVVAFAGQPPAELGRTPSGGIDWRFDPYRNRSWALNLHTLRWMGRLVVAYERSGERGHLECATDIARDWASGNPRGGARVSEWAWAEHAVALRGPALVALSAHVLDPWLAASLAEHADVLADPALYREGHNHGLDQDIALLLIGRRLGDTARTRLAIDRMTASAELAIDEQGALHEQAPRYGLYVHRRLGVALRLIENCGQEVPARLAARRAALAHYIAHATQPDGRLAPLGDSPADTRPPRFAAAQTSTVRVFDAGYVFGRTAWDDPQAAYYSIRFGPGRRLHGHEDHLGVTYHAGGHDVLVEAGFDSYERTEFRQWTLSPEAHSVPIVQRAAFRPGTATSLDASAIGPSRQCHRLSDDAYGVRRTRTVLVNHGPDLMAVLDEVPDGWTLRDLWHFAPALRVAATAEGRVTLAADDRRVTLLQFRPPDHAPVPGQSVRQGTVCTGYLRRAEAVTVVSPAASRLLTLIVPGPGDPEVTPGPDGALTVHTATGPVTLPAGLF
ncbi:hypothetical protein DP939_13830 [Spongiactinospora rosea]|uniref:Uncharacterized protein n=1 Tax=Spongiactinospora rosea TaxID=2248750 RepID=A0A366M0S2_9ACTN|nr:heparinase II/III family protein [Spongiactinospora rosea]RBQ19785.1 hypothetical protein DP939_13830 [Spongiactinospora rosea]